MPATRVVCDARRVQAVADFRPRMWIVFSSVSNAFRQGAERDGEASSLQSPSGRSMVHRTRMLLGLFSSFGFAAACSGVDPNAKISSPPLPMEGGITTKDGGEAGAAGSSGSSSSSGGRVCPSCEIDDDCTNTCGPTPTTRYIWCCGTGTCYQWSSATCPDLGAPPPNDAAAPGD